MKQGLHVGRRIEIAALREKEDVGQTEQRMDRGSREALEMIRGESPAGKGEGQRDRRPERGKKSPDPPRIEAREAESPCPYVAHDHPGDQESAHHEEHVDADEPARKGRHFEMESDDEQHGDRAQSVDMRLVGHPSPLWFD